MYDSRTGIKYSNMEYNISVHVPQEKVCIYPEFFYLLLGDFAWRRLRVSLQLLFAVVQPLTQTGPRVVKLQQKNMTSQR